MITSPRLISSEPFLLTPLPDRVPRRQGLHLSELIQDWALEIGKAKRPKKERPEDRWIWFEEGFILEECWEAEYQRRFKARQLQRLPGVKLISQKGVIEDGVVMHPDGLLLDEELTLIESKYTRSKPPIEPEYLLMDHWAWGVATKGYARALRVTRVRFIVMWAGGYKPECRQYDFEYHQDDLDHNWECVLRYRDRRMA